MKRLLAAVLCCVLLSPASSVARTEPTAEPTPEPTPISPLQAALYARVAKTPGTGVIVGVIDHGTVTVLQAGSTGTGRPLDQETLFEIGSVTKTFTAMLLAQNVLAGSVRLNDPVSKYLLIGARVPSRNGKEITLLNLATQHSGLPRLPTNLHPRDPANPYADYTTTELFLFLSGYRLPRDPGDSFEDSTVGIGLLGVALANHAHRTYDRLVARNIFTPLGMNESTVTLTQQQRARFAVGHDANGRPTHPWDFSALAGAGAIRSTMHDMLLYLNANMGHGDLAKAALFAQDPRASAPRGKVGLVWLTDKPSGVIEYNGETAGFHAIIVMTPDRERGVVALANGGGSLSTIADLALGIKGPSI